MCFFRQIKAVTKFRQIKAVTKFRQIEALRFRKLSFGLRLKNLIGKSQKHHNGKLFVQSPP